MHDQANRVLMYAHVFHGWYDAYRGLLQSNYSQAVIFF